MSIKSKNALVDQILAEVPGQEMWSAIFCAWTQEKYAEGLLYVTNQQLGFRPKKRTLQTTVFPVHLLRDYHYKDGKLLGTLTFDFHGLPSVEMSSIADEETGTFLRWLERFLAMR